METYGNMVHHQRRDTSKITRWLRSLTGGSLQYRLWRELVATFWANPARLAEQGNPTQPHSDPRCRRAEACYVGETFESQNFGDLRAGHPCSKFRETRFWRSKVSDFPRVSGFVICQVSIWIWDPQPTSRFASTFRCFCPVVGFRGLGSKTHRDGDLYRWLGQCDCWDPEVWPLGDQVDETVTAAYASR